MPIPIHTSDPRVKRTRQLLQQAFLALMQEKGFQDTTVQDIADRATVNRATFYAHFTDKYDLIDSCIREQFQQLLISKLPAQSQWSVANLHLLIATVFDFLAFVQHDCTPAQRELDPTLESAVQEEVYGVLLRWLRPRVPTESAAQPETVARVTSWAIFGTAGQWCRGTRTPPSPAMTRQVLAVVQGGLTAIIATSVG